MLFLVCIYFPPSVVLTDSSSGLSLDACLHPSHVGKVEFLKGIHDVFKGMPLFWARGYLGRSLDVMEAAAADVGHVKLSKDAVRRKKLIALNILKKSD